MLTQLKNASKSPKLVYTDSEESDDEKQEPVKKVKPTYPTKEKAPKSREFVEKDSHDSEH